MAFEIIVLQRGWVIAGNRDVDGDTVTMTSCKIVRIWGTTSGLGEIAKGGPTEKTVLDDAGTTFHHTGAEVLRFKCNAEAWGGDQDAER